MKRLTAENWLRVDPAMTGWALSRSGEPRAVEPDDYVQLAVAPTLDPSVPEEIATLYEAARGAFAYGIFHYPLLTLGTEQLYRVLEAGIKLLAVRSGAPKRQNHRDAIDWLADRQLIEDRDRLHDLRQLRNSASHPTFQQILPPGLAFPMLHRVADELNVLFGGRK